MPVAIGLMLQKGKQTAGSDGRPERLVQGVNNVINVYGWLAWRGGCGRPLVRTNPDAALAVAMRPEALADAMEQTMKPAMHHAPPLRAAASGRKPGDWNAHAVKLCDGLRHVDLD